MNDLYNKFLSDLKNELLKRNITQETLAYDIGVTPVTVCKFFRRKSVSMNLINKISEYIEYFDNNNLDEFFEKEILYGRVGLNEIKNILKNKKEIKKC